MSIDLATQRGDRRPVSLTGRYYAGEWVEGVRPRELLPLGLVGEGSSLKMSEEVTNLPDTENLAGGNAYTMHTIKDATIELKQFDWHRANLARALYGEYAVTPEQTLYESFQITRTGIMLPLAYLSAQNPELTSQDFTPNKLKVGVQGTDEVVFTAVKNGTPTVKIIDANQVNAETIVSVVANKVSITPKNDGVTIIGTLQEVVDAVNAHASASLLLSAAVGADSDPTNEISAIVETALSGSTGTYFELGENAWSLDPSGSGLIVPTNSTIPLNTDLKMAYSIPEQVRVDAMKDVPNPVSLVGLKQNKANGGKSERIWMYKVQFGLAAAIDLFKKEFNDLTIVGSLQKDTTAKNAVVNGASTPLADSDYYHWEFV